MKWPILLFAIAVLIGAADATEYPFNVTRVLDGDTVEGDAILWPGLTLHIRVRINRIDTPEIHTRRACEKADGYRAQRYTRTWLGAEQQATLVDVSLGKYAGRVLGDFVRDNHRLSDDLVLSHNAQRYDGGTKTPWQCRNRDEGD